MKLLRASLLSLPLVSLACIDAPAPTKQTKADAEAKSEPATKPEPVAKLEPVTAETDRGLAPTTEPLTAEEERLIAADPKTLSPEESRLRAHALRKKIMLQPGSDAAQALNDARAAVLSGAVDPNAPEQAKDGAADAGGEDKGLVLSAPTLKDGAAKDGAAKDGAKDPK